MMRRLRSALRRVWPLFAGGLFACVVIVADPPLEARAGVTNGVCIPSTLSYTPTWYPQCTAAGEMKVTGTFTPSGTQNVNVTQFGGNNVVTGTGASGVGIPRVTVSNDSTVIATQPTGSLLHTFLDSDTVSSGNLLALQTLNATILTSVVSKGVVAWQVVGLTGQSATLTFEASTDGGTTWNAVNAATGTTDPATSTITTDGRYIINAGGATNVRLRVSTAGATTNATISYVASPTSTMDGITLPLPPGGNTIGAVTQNGTWNVGGLGTAGTPSGGVVSIQGVASGTVVPVNLGQIGGSSIALGQTTMSASLPVAIASDQAAISVKQPAAATATRTSVAATTTTTTCLASNAGRRGAVIQNNSTATLFLIFGSAGGVSDYTYSIPAQSNWEDPVWNYTGIIGCVWTAATGNAYVTEVSP